MAEYVEIAVELLLVIIILVVVFSIFLLYKFLQIRKKKTTVGTFIGEKAKTIDPIKPNEQGYVLFKGEYWQAKSDIEIAANTKVVIIGKDEETLIIKPK